MRFPTLLAFLKLGHSRTPAPASPGRPGDFSRPAVEALEDRLVPAALKVSDVSIIEGNAGYQYAEVNVTLDAPSAKTVRVNYATADGTAKVRSDYDAVAGKLIFTPGQTSLAIVVPVRGDLRLEPNETIFVKLHDAKNAKIADGQGVVTIVTDDPSLSIGDVSAVEGDGGSTLMTFTVSLSAAAKQTVSATWATADGTAQANADYQGKGGTVTFKPGEKAQTLTVAVQGDAAPELDETFFVNITSAGATIADSQAVGTIQDDEPHITISDGAVVEGSAGTTQMMFTVSLSSAAEAPMSVDFATGDSSALAGEDYVAVSGTVKFGIGDTTKDIIVEVHGDVTAEPDEAFVINLTNATANAAILRGQAFGTIYDDDGYYYYDPGYYYYDYGYYDYGYYYW